MHVHGHGQCARCGSNVEPCCAGAGDEAELALPLPVPAAEPALPLPALFAALGGRDLTVTQDALVHAVCCQLGCDRLAACERLLHEVAAGRLQRIGHGWFRLPG